MRCIHIAITDLENDDPHSWKGIFFPNEDFSNDGISEEGGQFEISIFIKEGCEDLISYLP